MVGCLCSPALCISRCGCLTIQKLNVIECHDCCHVCQCSQYCSNTQASSKKWGEGRRVSKLLLELASCEDLKFFCLKRGNKMNSPVL